MLSTEAAGDTDVLKPPYLHELVVRSDKMAGVVVIGLLILGLLPAALCELNSISLPRDIEALNGSCVFIPCSFIGNYRCCQNQIGVWISNDPFRGNEVFRNDTSNGTWKNIRVAIGDVNEKNCSTQLDRVGPQQGGTYYFRTEGTYSYTFRYNSFTITVLDSPRKTSITGHPVKDIPEGCTVTLSCTSNANPPSSYSWYHVSRSSVTQRGSGQELTITNVTPSDGGLYHCEAKNQHGAENSTAITIGVLTPQCPHLLVSALIGGLVFMSILVVLLLLLLFYYRKRMKKMESQAEDKDVYLRPDQTSRSSEYDALKLQESTYEKLNKRDETSEYETINKKDPEGVQSKRS